MSARILVVDDTPANIQMLASVLKASGYQISAATNGKQALDTLERVVPDLILLDIMMPEMDGFETCRRIKQSEAWREIPIIFLTGRSDSADIVQGFELGAVDYVAKPFNTHELLARVSTHLTMHQLRSSLAEKNAALGRANEIVRSAFGRYVSEEVAATVLASPEALELGGEEREITVLMSDLRGFTALAARLTPHDVIDALNLYLEAMVEVIGAHQGMINEIIGDGILVIFGAPVASDDHAEKAVACGLAMQLAMTGVNAELAQRKGPQLEMGVGIHTGPVVVGNIGSMRRTKYAAVGSNVNLAARIESFTTGGQLLISEATRDRVHAALHINATFEVQPKGMSQSLPLLDVGGIGEPYNLVLPQRVEDLRALVTPMAVHFTVLEEKFMGRTMHEGTFVALSEGGAMLHAGSDVAALSNVWITVQANAHGQPEGEIYAKVLETFTEQPARARIRFTSVSPELKDWLKSAAGAAS